MCGIVGMVSRRPVNQQIYDALTVLQHRGQDAAGIITSAGGQVHLRKAAGLVSEVFQQRHIDRLVGRTGIGHVRYPTAGTSSFAEAQPMYVNSPHGIALAHNGNLTNAEPLRTELEREDLRHVNTSSDSEVLLNVFAHELRRTGAREAGPAEVFRAVAGVHQRCRGAYAAVAMIVGVGILGFRDPFGIRPLVYGRRAAESGGFEYMIASESVALDMLGFDLIADLAPGEAVLIDEQGAVHTKVCAEESRCAPCIFEYVYLARPDSIIDDISVYKSRLRMGEFLAKRILQRHPEHDIDVVKNRYIGRTFIMPGQSMRKRSVRHKFNTIGLEFKGKNVLLVDDSIVRGTTTTQIVQMARDAGARKVFVASASPPIRHPNVYGIDMPAAEELVAFQRSEEEVGRAIGADWLIYQRLEDLVKCARRGNKSIKRFECSVFDGRYLTGDIDQTHLKRLSLVRSDKAKQRREAETGLEQNVIELHNHA